MSIDSTDAIKNIEARIAELTNISRLISNTLNLIADVEIKGAYAGPVSEIQGWLTGFKQSVASQMDALQATLPKPVEPIVAAPVEAPVEVKV